MKKLLLIDGNNMLFKAYHATLYGRMMTTSNGIPTNAVFGFIHMIQKSAAADSAGLCIGGLGQRKADVSS